MENGPSLVGRGRDEHADEFPEIEVERQHQVSEVFEQRRVRRWVVLPKIVVGLDDPHAHHLAPHAIGDRAGKLAVVAGGHPGGELGPSVERRRGGGNFAPQHVGRYRGQRLGVVVLVVVRQEQLGLMVVDPGQVRVDEQP